MRAFIKALFTDALDRPEPKMVLGIPMVIATVVYVMISKELAIAGFLMGTALALIGVTAVADAKNDTRSKEQ